MTKYSMGLDLSLMTGTYEKRKNRWMMEIPDAIGENVQGVNILPPLRSSRPMISFKEMLVAHLSEDVYYPAKPEWKPIQVTAYDINTRKGNPVFKWLKQYYDPEAGKLYAPNANQLIKEVDLRLYNGCGEIVECWVYQDVWPQQITFDTLDMGESGVLTCEITLRYVRAYEASCSGSSS